MPRILKILLLFGIMACSDFPEIPYEGRNFKYGEPITDRRTDAENPIREYKTIIIGSQTWMAENLNYKISETGDRKYNCINCNEYGVLYNWEAATKACPEKWHLPSDNDWNELLKFVGGDFNAGKKLKSKTEEWISSGNGEDSYGFAALPGGLCFGSKCDYNGLLGVWWSTTTEENEVFGWAMAYNEIKSSEFTLLKDAVRRIKGDSKTNIFFSVRCIKGN
jgi:uncharacterized protein (TIGR02145 family)